MYFIFIYIYEFSFSALFPLLFFCLAHAYRWIGVGSTQIGEAHVDPTACMRQAKKKQRRKSRGSTRIHQKIEAQEDKNHGEMQVYEGYLPISIVDNMIKSYK